MTALMNLVPAKRRNWVEVKIDLKQNVDEYDSVDERGRLWHQAYSRFYLPLPMCLNFLYLLPHFCGLYKFTANSS